MATRQTIINAFKRNMRGLGYDYPYVLSTKGIEISELSTTVERLTVNMQLGTPEEFTAIRKAIEIMSDDDWIEVSNLRLEV